MSRRNPQNARYRDDSRKGATRRSSGSAKIKSSAGSSVYVASKKTKEKRKENAAKDRERKAREAIRDKENIKKAEGLLTTYKKWQRVWLILIIIAVVAVVLSFGGSYLIGEGKPLEALLPARNVFLYGGMIVGYACIIGAIVVDFKFVRPVRKAQTAVMRKESAKEKKHREEEAAAKKEKKSFFKRKDN